MSADLLLQFVPMAVLGALLGLDVVSFPQAMLSRPIVAATLAGTLIGEAGHGLLIGVALEFFALESMPFGASRYPEWGSAAVVGGTLFSQLPDGTAGAMSLAVFAALVTAGVGGWSIVLLRRLNAHWARRQQARIARGSGSATLALQLGGLTADLLRGGLITGLGLVAFSPVFDAVIATTRVSGTLSRAVVVAIASAVGLAAVWKVVHTTAGARWFLLAGLAGGLLLAGSMR